MNTIMSACAAIILIGLGIWLSAHISAKRDAAKLRASARAARAAASPTATLDYYAAMIANADQRPAPQITDIRAPVGE